MGSAAGTVHRCTGCGNGFAQPIYGRATAYCEDCVHAEETEPACTCLLPADVLGWPHARTCPRNPANRKPAFTWNHR